MGQNSSAALFLKTKKIGLTPLPDEYKEVQLHRYCHPSITQTLTCYSIMINSVDQLEFTQHLNLRRAHPDLFPQIVHGEVVFVCKDYMKIELYIETVLLTTEKIFGLQFQDALAVIYNAAKGFSALFSRGINLSINSKMIGFTENGETKIWLHQKFTRFRQKRSFEYENHVHPQECMVEQLIKIFYSIVDTSTIPKQFNLTYVKYFSLLNEYIEIHSKNITNRIEAIVQFYEKNGPALDLYSQHSSEKSTNQQFEVDNQGSRKESRLTIDNQTDVKQGQKIYCSIQSATPVERNARIGACNPKNQFQQASYSTQSQLQEMIGSGDFLQQNIIPFRPQMTLRDEYLKPFRSQQQNYKQAKLLPHISEQFIFRRRNKLLVDRIINPKRDQIIMKSLDRCVRKHNRSLNHRYLSSAKPARQEQSKTSEQFFRWNNRKEGKYNRTFHEECKESGGRVLTNIRQQKEENAQKQSIFYRRIRPNPILDEDKQNEQGQISIQQERRQTEEESADFTSPHIQFINKTRQITFQHKYSPLETFGNGPTIISLSRLKIISNPPIKPESLLILELIEKPFLDKVSEEKTIRTAPIPYRYFINHEVKFALKISSIGDFIPLRIWQCSGVECNEIGLLDLNLAYNSGLPQAESYIQKKGHDFYRQVYSQSVERQLKKIGGCQVGIHYKIYSKRFKKIEE